MGTARRKRFVEGTGRPGGAGVETRPRLAGIHNREMRRRPGVGEAHSSEEASNDRGAKGPCWKHADVRGGKTRLDQRPTTEPGKHIEALKKQASGDGLPGKLFSPRQKLGQRPNRSQSSGSTRCMAGSS